jgi:hypothetical protein
MPKATRPKFPKGYVDNPTSQVPWDYIETKLRASKHYWMCSVRPNGKPHVVPRWAVYLHGKLYYDGSPETRHAKNILENPNITVNLEDGQKAIILEGTSTPASKPDPGLAQQLSAEYTLKYESEGYAPKPDQWDQGGLFIFSPRQCIAWTTFFENPTKFVIDP